ncbi:MAG: 4'-phosphopantetheinyl transferase superfamily protein, partial [Paracoccaceae bacterium]
DALAGTRLFCAKEALYKAQYAVTAQLLGFDAVEVTLGAGRFEARFRQAVGRFREGTRLQGQMREGGGFILAAVVLPPAGHAGPETECFS